MFEGFCYYGNKSAILLSYSIFKTTVDVSSKLDFVQVCQVSKKLWLFDHKRADFWLPNFGFKTSFLCLKGLYGKNLEQSIWRKRREKVIFKL